MWHLDVKDVTNKRLQGCILRLPRLPRRANLSSALPLLVSVLELNLKNIAGDESRESDESWKMSVVDKLVQWFG